MNSSPPKVIVVGAASGIGAATTTYLHNRGSHVLAVDYKDVEADAAKYSRCDLRDADSIARLLETVGDDWDALAYVAGVPGTAPPVDVLAVNFLGFRAVAEGMLRRLRPGGAIVGVASVAGMAWRHRIDALTGLFAAAGAAEAADWYSRQDPNYPVYSTSKEALIIHAKQLATGAGRQAGVRVNTVSPGPVQTPILGDFEKTMGKDVLDAVRGAVGRHATVDDIAPLIAFLCSAESSWISGQDIQVDGGFAATALQ